MFDMNFFEGALQ
jgi:hypothetical protein